MTQETVQAIDLLIEQFHLNYAYMMYKAKLTNCEDEFKILTNDLVEYLHEKRQKF